MASTPAPTNSASNNAAPDFLRALNVLFKNVRLYGGSHQRSDEQLKEVWMRLGTLLVVHSNVLLGVADQKLLVNGHIQRLGPAERSFVHLLSAAGISSVQFSEGVTSDALKRFAEIVSTVRVGDLLKTMQVNSGALTGIRVNELRFVVRAGGATDAPLTSAFESSSVAYGAGQNTKEDARQSGSMLLGSRILAGNPEATDVGEAQPAWQWIVQLAKQMQPAAASVASSSMDEDSRLLLERAQASLLGSDGDSQDGSQSSPQTETQGVPQYNHKTLLKAAEHLAIQYAIQRYESGDVKVNAVHELLERLGKEISTLRGALSSQEEKLAQAGIAVESQADLLDRQFWAAVPDRGKTAVLLSDDAWCIPPRNVLSYVQELLVRGDTNLAHEILRTYCALLASTDPEARRKVATGVSTLADVIAQCGGELAIACTRQVGRQLIAEKNADLQAALSSVLAKMVRDCCSHRSYRAVEQALAAVAHLERTNPALAKDLSPRIRLENRLPEFIREAVAATKCPEGLIQILKRTPRAALTAIVTEFAKSGKREVCDRLAFLARDMGAPALDLLTEDFRTRPSAEAVFTVGLLATLGSPILQEELDVRIKGWPVAHQVSAVRHIAASGAEQRGGLLVSLLNAVTPTVSALVVDELGFEGTSNAGPRLLEIAANETGCAPFLRLKAIEALGRLREMSAIPLLRSLIVARKMFGWQHHDELRITALHALWEIQPRCQDDAILRAAFKPRDLQLVPHRAEGAPGWSRLRRYPRVTPTRALIALANTTSGGVNVAIEKLSLGGGLAMRHSHAQLATEGLLEAQCGFRRFRARVLIHELGARRLTFEIVNMDFDDRWRLRQLLNEHLANSAAIEPITHPVSSATTLVAAQASFPDDPGYCR